MRILVCGGRDFTDEKWMYEVLSTLGGPEDPIEEIISGMANGADTLAGDYAYTQGIKFLGFPADWKKHGKAAGPIRNKQMLDEGKPDFVIAFPGGKGTQNMINQAEKAGIPVTIIKKPTDADSN